MTTTDTKLEHWEMVKMAVAEIDSTILIRRPPGEVGRYEFIGCARTAKRASRLALLSTEGPEAPSTCAAHGISNRPDLWDACLKVRVMDALNGLTCDTHGLLNSEAAA